MTTPFLLLLVLQADSKCVLEGKVENAITATPLQKATVSLELDGSNTRSTEVSGAAGEFVFADLEPGDYTLKAQRVGYLDGADQEITLEAGKHKKDVAVKLTPQGLISGRVVDEDGDPIPGASITYQRSKGDSGGQQVDGEGHFAITALKAGRYYLWGEIDHEQRGPTENRTKSPYEVYVATYYPNALEPRTAIPIDVAPGAEVRNIEIRLRKARVVRVRGKLRNLTAGASGMSNRLFLRRADDERSGLRTSMRSAQIVDGSFEFIDVLPGSYILLSDGNLATEDKSGNMLLALALGNQLTA